MPYRITLLFYLITSILFVQAQTTDSISKVALLQYIAAAPYPNNAKKKGYPVKVSVVFVIDTSGAVTNVRLRQSSKSAILDNAAIDYISKMPKWTPGYQSGKAVNVSMIMNVNYEFQGLPLIEPEKKKK